MTERAPDVPGDGPRGSDDVPLVLDAGHGSDSSDRHVPGRPPTVECVARATVEQGSPSGERPSDLELAPGRGTVSVE